MIIKRCLGYYAPQGKLYDYDANVDCDPGNGVPTDELPAITPLAGDEITIDTQDDLDAVAAILEPFHLKLSKQEGFITFYDIIFSTGNKNNA